MSLLERLHAAAYDPVLAWSERSGLAARRARLLGHARGRVLEIGAGTGLNVPHYALDAELVLTDASEPMARRLRRRLQRLRRRAEVVVAPAESLPSPAGAFDAVVSTLVLCSVHDPARSLSEVRRVLRPGGVLLLMEHVRSERPALARWQDRLAPAWRLLNRGCTCNRPTAALVEQAGFRFLALECDSLPKAPPLVRPLIVGRAEPL